METTLSFGNQRALVSDLGASLRRYYLEDPSGKPMDLLWGYQGDANKKAGQGDVLIPFPSRVKDATYRFGNEVHQLPRNDKEGPNSIHGFVREMKFTSEQLKPSSIRFESTIRAEEFREKGFPFSLHVSIAYRLDRFGLTTEFTLKNVGDRKCPAGAGFHPYFTLGSSSINECLLKLPASKYLEFQNLTPTGRILDVAGTPNDFRKLKAIGATQLNFCFTELTRDSEGLAWTELSSASSPGKALKIWMDAAFNYLVIYSGDAIPGGDARRSLAIEPMTCATDAFNHPDWGLSVLEPGETLTGRFGVRPPAT